MTVGLRYNFPKRDVCACVCVCERERGREKVGEGKRKREKGRERGRARESKEVRGREGQGGRGRERERKREICMRVGVSEKKKSHEGREGAWKVGKQMESGRWTLERGRTPFPVITLQGNAV